MLPTQCLPPCLPLYLWFVWCKYLWHRDHDACIHDACIYEASIPDACFHDAHIPDACIHVHMSYIHDDVSMMHVSTKPESTMHVSMMHVYIMHVSMVWWFVHSLYLACMYACCVYPGAWVYDSWILSQTPAAPPIENRSKFCDILSMGWAAAEADKGILGVGYFPSQIQRNNV